MTIQDKKDMNYGDFKKAQSKELDEFLKGNVFWAFNRKQLEEKLQELKITEDDLVKKYAKFYGGGLIKKDKIDEYINISDAHAKELKTRMKGDYDFAKSAFRYEMGNYECFFSFRFDEVFGALALTESEIEYDDNLRRAFNEAKNEYWEWCIENC